LTFGDIQLTPQTVTYEVAMGELVMSNKKPKQPEKALKTLNYGLAVTRWHNTRLF
jgi:hypothetical protein